MSSGEMKGSGNSFSARYRREERHAQFTGKKLVPQFSIEERADLRPMLLARLAVVTNLVERRQAFSV